MRTVAPLVAVLVAVIVVGVLAGPHSGPTGSGGIDADTLLPVGPFTWVSDQPYPGATGTPDETFDRTFFILGDDEELGPKDWFMRLMDRAGGT